LFKQYRPPFRHDDHKFEMNREEFKQWSDTIAKENGKIRNKFFYNLYPGYSVYIDGIGLPKTNDISRGFCTQIAVFQKQQMTELSHHSENPL